MQKKSIDITMKHLASNFTIVIFMTMCFISCSHIAHMAYNEDHISSRDSDEEYPEEYSEMNHPPRKEEYKKIYCTSKDEKKGVKTTIDYLHVACGLSKIQPIDNRTLEIKRIVSGIKKLTVGDMLLGHHLLILKSGSKILQEMKVENEGYDPFWKEVRFVKIRKGVYWQDLNNDGHPEFAVLKTDTGNAAYRPADIYTLKNESFHFYGNGRYVWTTGEHVMFNCPKCTRRNLEECKKCT